MQKRLKIVINNCYLFQNSLFLCPIKFKQTIKQPNKMKTKMKIELTIEKASEFQARKIGYQYYSLVSDPKKNPSIDNMVETMEAIANTIQAKVGRGGNHVWISNPNNERIAIITFR